MQVIDVVNTRHAVKGVYKDIEGSPYLQADFVAGKIIYRKNPMLGPVPLRYNVYEDAIEYYLNDHVMELLAFPEVDRVVMGEDVLVFGSHQQKGKEHTGYYFLLEEGSYSLLKKSIIVLAEAVAAKPMQDAKPARFEPKKDKYFIAMPDGSIFPISSKKELIRLFGKGKFSTFIKNEKIQVGKTKDLLKLIQFTNTQP